MTQKNTVDVTDTDEKELAAVTRHEAATLVRRAWKIDPDTIYDYREIAKEVAVSLLSQAYEVDPSAAFREINNLIGKSPGNLSGDR